MSQLIEIYNWLILLWIYFTTIFLELITFLLFYPTGIFFSIWIILQLIYILTVFKSLIMSHFQFIRYLLDFQLSFPEIWNKLPVKFFWDLAVSFLLNNSNYHYVFLLKRFQFIVFLVFIILIFF